MVKHEPRISTIEVSDETITAHLTAGRIIVSSLVWSWQLTKATPEQRNNDQMIGNGYGVHWPDVDEDSSARSMLEGAPAPPAKQSV